jgi:hypothetical protein
MYIYTTIFLLIFLPNLKLGNRRMVSFCTITHGLQNLGFRRLEYLTVWHCFDAIGHLATGGVKSNYLPWHFLKICLKEGMWYPGSQFVQNICFFLELYLTKNKFFLTYRFNGWLHKIPKSCLEKTRNKSRDLFVPEWTTLVQFNDAVLF